MLVRVFSSWALLIVIFSSCVHERDNPYDPGNPTYQLLEAPGDLTAICLQPESIYLTWTIDNNRVERIFIQKGTDSIHLAELVELSGNVSSYVDSSCRPFTVYYYKIGIVDKLEKPVYCHNLVKIRTSYHTPMEMPSTSTLPLPTGLKITRCQKIPQIVRIEWNRMISGIYGYVLHSGIIQDSLVCRHFYSVSDTCFLDTLGLDTTYYYSLRVYDTLNVAQNAILDSITPQIPPNNLKLLFVDAKNIRVIWDTIKVTVSQMSTDSICLERSVGEGKVFEEIACLAPGTITYLDTALQSYSLYGYRVRAFSGKVVSSPSNQEVLFVKTIRPAQTDSTTLLLYHFDENEGDSLIDLSGENRGGYLNTAQRVQKGKFGNSLSFSSGEYAFSTATLPYQDSSLMVDFWVKPATYWPAGIYQGMVESKGGPFQVYYYNDSIVSKITFLDESVITVSCAAQFLTTRWSHVVISYGHDFYRLYLQDSIQQLIRTEKGAMKTIAESLFIGKVELSGQPYFMEGFIDEFRIKSEPEPFFLKVE